MLVHPMVWALLALVVLIAMFELVRKLPGVSGTQSAAASQFMVGAASFVQGYDFSSILGQQAVSLLLLVNGLFMMWARTRTSTPGKLSE